MSNRKKNIPWQRRGLPYFLIFGLRAAWAMNRDCDMGLLWSLRFQWSLAWIDASEYEGKP